MVISFALCALAHGANDNPRRFKARITYYEPTACRYGFATSTGRYAVEGVTCAVDPRVIPYGSRVRVSDLKGVVGDGYFLAQDTGSAVLSRKASRAWGSDAPVVDIFVKSDKRLRAVERGVPMFCFVEIDSVSYTHLTLPTNREV